MKRSEMIEAIYDVCKHTSEFSKVGAEGLLDFIEHMGMLPPSREITILTGYPPTVEQRMAVLEWEPEYE